MVNSTVMLVRMRLKVLIYIRIHGIYITSIEMTTILRKNPTRRARQLYQYRTIAAVDRFIKHYQGIWTG